MQVSVAKSMLLQQNVASAGNQKLSEGSSGGWRITNSGLFLHTMGCTMITVSYLICGKSLGLQLHL